MEEQKRIWAPVDKEDAKHMKKAATKNKSKSERQMKQKEKEELYAKE